MQPGPRAAAVAGSCLLARAIAVGCSTPTVRGTGVWYTCCSDSVVSTRWHPGLQLPVIWARSDNVPPGHSFQPVTLSAVLTGPFRNATALKAAITRNQGGKITAAAPQIRVSRNPPRSPVSVIAIPANAPAGLYNLRTSASSGGGSETGSVILTVG